MLHFYSPRSRQLLKSTGMPVPGALSMVVLEGLPFILADAVQPGVTCEHNFRATLKKKSEEHIHSEKKIKSIH